MRDFQQDLNSTTEPEDSDKLQMELIDGAFRGSQNPEAQTCILQSRARFTAAGSLLLTWLLSLLAK